MTTIALLAMRRTDVTAPSAAAVTIVAVGVDVVAPEIVSSQSPCIRPANATCGIRRTEFMTLMCVKRPTL